MKIIKLKTNKPKEFKKKFISIIGMGAFQCMNCSYKGNVTLIVDSKFYMSPEYNEKMYKIITQLL